MPVMNPIFISISDILFISQAPLSKAMHVFEGVKGLAQGPIVISLRPHLTKSTVLSG